ncbi:MAG: tetratricopeptide repeat protein [Ginsengibacter sp.]
MTRHFSKIVLFFLINAWCFAINAQSGLKDSLKIDSVKKLLQTQKEDSSKVNSLNDLSTNALAREDFDNSMQYAKEALTISEKLNYKKGKADAFYNMVSVMGQQSYTDQSVYPEMYRLLFNTLELYEELGNGEGIAQCYESLGGLKYNEGDYAAALKNNYTALKYYEQLGNKKFLATIYRKIAYVYDVQDNIGEALKFYQLSLQLNVLARDSTLIAGNYINIGRMFFLQGDYSAALKKYLEGLEMLKQIRNKTVLPFSYQNIGNVYEKQGEIALAAGDKATAVKKFSDALENYQTSLKMLKEINYADALAQLYGTLGNVYIKLNKLVLARSYLEESLRSSLAMGYNEQIKDSYLGLSKLDSLQGNYAKAYEHYKSYISLRDKLANEESTKKSIQVKMQYDFEKKESAAKIAQEQKDAEARRIKNWQYLAIAILGVVVLAVIILAFIQWRNNKQKHKANILLQQQKEKVESTLSELRSTQAQLIQSEKMASLGELTAGIAHEIQNPLNFVNNFSEVNTELIDEAGQEIDKGNISAVKTILNDIKENEQKINHHGRRADSIVKGMLQHSRSSSGLKEPTDINALADEYLRLAYHGLRAKDNSFNASMKTDYDATIGNVNIIRQDIGRVLLNLFNNAFFSVNDKKKKLGEVYDPLVSISTRKINDLLEIKVKDNGSGIPEKVLGKIYQPFFTTKPTGQGTGLGLSLSYDIVTREHGGTIKVSTKENEFAEFVIKLPIPG